MQVRARGERINRAWTEVTAQADPVGVPEHRAYRVPLTSALRGEATTGFCICNNSQIGLRKCL